ncbi:MAG: LamG-like jellyroll fold domain-containing protein [Reichenbachiella sp.]|uniref:CBM96 family carbohydrate-binding protein n=1 Tax=Reichenbachiella sp. TaxID=2184521 RepID=UPI00326340F7
MIKIVLNKIKIIVLNLLMLLVLLHSNISQAQLLPNHITISVPRGDDNGFVTMELDKYSVRDPNHCKFYVDPQSYTTAGDPSGANPNNFNEKTLNDTNYPVRTYRGYVVEQPNSMVIAVIWPGNNTMSAYTQEGVRYLWDIEDLPINLNLTTGQASVSVSNSQAYTHSSINEKATDWVPTFGNPPHPTPGTGSGPVANGGSTHGWKLVPSGGFKKLQVAYDVEPEYFSDPAKANGSNQKLFAIMEAATNALDLQFARDLGIQMRLTGVIRRTNTNLHTDGSDTKITWITNGLGDNPGASNVKPNSIPVQQIVYTVPTGSGNPSAYQTRTPLAGGNFTKVPVRLDENSGLQHEVSHTWGGAHFVYPNDIMSGGGSWFGPTTNQRHVYNRENAGVSGNLPVATNAQYGWNVHPYATPDLARVNIGQSATIKVLKNDFDSNGDDVKIADFDATTSKGGTVTLNNGNLVYTPAPGFQGRDQFNYMISDGVLHNTTWVQVDVNNGGLLMRYDFESGGSVLQDATSSNFDATAENFTGSTTSGKAGNGWNFPQLPNANDDDDDTGRAFVSFGDVIDPFDGSHTVSLWFKMNSYSINDAQTDKDNCYLISNSSTVRDNLVSGYNIFYNGKDQKLTFQLAEQLELSHPEQFGELLTIEGSDLQANTWYHIVLVVDRSSNKMKAYVNGSKITNSQDLKPGGIIKGKPEGDRYTSGALAIATYKPKKFTPFVGTMDEFRAYGRALTLSEIQDLYNNPGDPLGGGDPPPAAPTGLLVTAGNGTVSLDWANNSEPDLASYAVKRSTTSGGAYTQIATVTSSSYTDNGVTNGTTYYYVVSAIDNGSNESPNSAQAQGTPQGSGGGGTFTFNPIDDAYVREAGADNIYDRTYLRVKAGSGARIFTFIKFTVTGVSGSVTDAKLRLYSKDDINTVRARLGDSNSWGETTLTWNNKPSHGNAITTINVTADAWNEWDVSSAITGNGTYTFVLTTSTNANQLDFQSSEDTNQPELVITTGNGARTRTNEIGSKELEADPKALIVYPNAVNEVANLQYWVQQPAHVNLSVFDVMGKRVKTLIDSSKKVGTHTIQWNLISDSDQRVIPGLYMARLTVNGISVQTARIILKK